MIRPLLALTALTLVSGCAAWPALPVLQSIAQPERATVSPPGTDGTRYLAVESGPLSSPGTLRRRWAATARRVCEGEYTKIAEATGTRKSNGITKARIHEGYIQCVLPGEQEVDPAGPTADDATRTAAKRPSRARGARAASRSPTR